jgi:hypothetical protein
MERRQLGYLVDSVIVFERVAGTLLPEVDFDALPPAARQTLFHRLGRTLRLIERQGLNQYDSKSSNWMVLPDEKLGPAPVVIDVDGIRKIVPALWPIDRLLRSLRELPRYTPEDSRWVCVGYRPNAHLVVEDARARGKGEDAVPHPNPLPKGEGTGGSAAHDANRSTSTRGAEGAS